MGVRVCVLGNSGSGKSTLARALAEDLGLTYIELDSLFHQPNWESTPREIFRDKVIATQQSAQQATRGWVCDGNYLSHISDLTVQQADVIVCFQLPRSRVMWQLTRRTLRRTILREPLWNDNRERVINMFRLNPQANILRWAWTQHANYIRKFAQVRAESDAHWIDVRSTKDREQVVSRVRALAD